MSGTSRTAEQRLTTLLSRVSPGHGGCWLWTGHTMPTGYGLFSLYGKKIYAHRAAVELMVGPIPAGLQIDHLCRTRACINPSHLEAVTQAENVRRAFALVTQCPQGHAYDESNTYRNSRGHRKCRACRREGMRSAR